METVSGKEFLLLKKLKSRISDLEVDDEDLDDRNMVRWLRARKGNTQNAEAMFRDHISWSLRTEEILREKFPPSWGRKEFNWWITGKDKYGNMVTCFPIGHVDLKSFCENGEASKVFRFSVNQFLLLLKALKKGSKDKPWVNQVYGIYDCEGFSYSQIWCVEAVKLVIRMGKMWEANFPETLRKAFFINTPPAFHMAYNIFSSIMEERTMAKVSILGSSKDVWRTEINKYIPLSEFPKCYGGEGSDDVCVRLENYNF